MIDTPDEWRALTPSQIVQQVQHDLAATLREQYLARMLEDVLDEAQGLQQELDDWQREP